MKNSGSELQPVEKQQEISVGVVLRKSPSNTVWQKWLWRPVGLLPGSDEQNWKLLREDSGIYEYHAGSKLMELHRAEVESYKVALSMTPASAFVILERNEIEDVDNEYSVHKVTASAYEAQDYSDSDEYLVEAVPMPPSLLAWVEKFVDYFFEEKPFVKRKRDKVRIDKIEEGVGDHRIAKHSDVYRSPSSLKLRKDN